MGQSTEAFVGIDAAKKRNAIAVAEAGRDGEVRYWGEVDASPSHGPTIESPPRAIRSRSFPAAWGTSILK